MPLSIKIVHTADLHLGATLLETPFLNWEKRKARVDDFLSNLKRIRDFAIREKVDYLIISGDIFHNLRPSGYVLSAFAETISTLGENKVKTVAVAGNHDQPKTKTYTKTYLEALKQAKPPNFFFFRKSGYVTLENRERNRKVKFIALPYVSPVEFRDEREYRKTIEERVKQYLEKGEADYVVVVAHFLVEGARPGAEQKIMFMKDVKLNRGIFEKADVDYVAMGHIHACQKLSEKTVYPGSVERIDFSEEKEEKGFISLTEQNGELALKFQKLNCRPMLTLPSKGEGSYFQLHNSINPSKALIQTMSRRKVTEGSIVRLKCLLGPGQMLNLREINKAMTEKNIFYWFIKREYLSPEKLESSPEPEKIEVTFEDYVKKTLSGKANPEVIELVIKKGKEIIDKVRHVGDEL